jgi:hypothetical protein
VRVLHIPLKEDGTEYGVDMLYEDQKEIVTIVFDTLHEFLTMDNLGDFKPLRLIINGQGGSGKSVVINTIVTLMRNMFGMNDVVKVVAPTGVAAYNVHGETFHHMLHMGVTKGEYKSNNMPSTTRMSLIKKFKVLMAMIIDERSLVASKILGTAEAMISETIFDGGHMQDDSWGGLPILMLVGDDYQLPGIGEGPFTALYSRYGTKMTYKGKRALMECSKLVMELGGSKRLQSSQSAAKAMLDRLRIGEDVQDEDVNKLMSLHLESMEAQHGKAVVEDIRARAMFLFYRNEKRIRHNLTRLIEVSSSVCPVAVIKSRSKGTTRAKAYRSHFGSDIPSSALICLECSVALNCRNFRPSWGLHNGACGIVREIIFDTACNPNNNEMPLYVVVEFPLYCGPPWDIDNPKVCNKLRHSAIDYTTRSDCIIFHSSTQLVPVPMVSFTCPRGCCSRQFCPLTTAYARTIHKFQGLTAGPVDVGKIPNMYSCIVCDPDEKHFESSALGLLYTAVSRATTYGDVNGLNSAIYFTGPAFKEDRIRNLTRKLNSREEFQLAKKRRLWVQHLKRMSRRTSQVITTVLARSDDILIWATSHRVAFNPLLDRIDKYQLEKLRPQRQFV